MVSFQERVKCKWCNIVDIGTIEFISHKSTEIQPYIFFFSPHIQSVITLMSCIVWNMLYFDDIIKFTLFICRYIFSLALADLLVIIICVPLASLVYTLESWPWGSALCRITECAKDISIGVSVFTLTALSAERYCAIVNPLRKLQVPKIPIIYTHSNFIILISVVKYSTEDIWNITDFDGDIWQQKNRVKWTMA